MPVRAVLRILLLCLLAAMPILGQTASLSVFKVDSPDPVAAGAPLTYTITVNNEGPDSAANAELTDILPAGTSFLSLPATAGWTCSTPAVGEIGTVVCSAATFAPGSAVFSLTVTVDAGTADGTLLVNTATIASTTSDPNANDNSASAETTVSAAPLGAVSITKSDAPDPVLTDSDLTYSITANSNVARTTDAATVSDTLPASVTFVSLAAPSGWSCTTPAVGASGTVSCAIAPYPQGDAIFTLVVHVAPNVAGNTILANSATLDVDDSGRTGSASGTATTRVLSPAALAATKAIPSTPSSTVSYSIVLTNSSTHAQGDNPGPELSDILPPALTLTGASATAGTTSIAGNTVTWNGALAAGASVTITITATVNPAANGTVIANQATIAYDADGDGTNEASGVSDDPATAQRGDPTAFTAALPVVSVPTLDAWGILAAALGLAVAGWRQAKSRSRRRI